jgi:hypothetical protein
MDSGLVLQTPQNDGDWGERDGGLRIANPP